jgi:hypothetical protein
MLARGASNSQLHELLVAFLQAMAAGVAGQPG